MSEVASSLNQSVDMATAYQDAMMSFQEGERGRDLIDSEKLKTSLAVKAGSPEWHALYLVQWWYGHVAAVYRGPWWHSSTPSIRKYYSTSMST